VTNVVAPQGTAFTPEQARLLRRFVERVILCFDSDTAGQNAVEKSLPALLSAGIGVKVATLPRGEDPDSLIRGQGVGAFRALLGGSVDFFDHAIDRAEREAIARSGAFGPREKASVGGRLAGYIALLPETALRETTSSHVGSRLGLSSAALKEAAAKNPLILSDQEDPGAQAGPVATPLRVSASTELICRLALLSPEVREWLSLRTSPTLEKLDPELALLPELIAPLSDLENPSLPAVLALIPDRFQPLISAWELEKMPGSPLVAVQDAFRNLHLQLLKKQQQSAGLLLRTPGLTREKMLSVQKEILDLQGKINDLSAPATSVSPALR
jgi:DNA primase